MGLLCFLGAKTSQRQPKDAFLNIFKNQQGQLNLPVFIFLLFLFTLLHLHVLKTQVFLSIL